MDLDLTRFISCTCRMKRAIPDVIRYPVDSVSVMV